MWWLTVFGIWLLNVGWYVRKTNHLHQTSNISGTLIGNKIVDHSDVIAASPLGAAPTKFSFST